MHLPKFLIFLLVIVIAAFFVGVGILVGARMVNGGVTKSDPSLSPYSAVYLSTGDVYFGILGWSPSPHIEDPWFLQRSTDATGQTTVGAYPFAQVTWGPSNAVYFNAQDIVFWTRLSSTSTVAEAMANPNSAPAPESVSPPEVPPVPTEQTTSTMATSSKPIK